MGRAWARIEATGACADGGVKGGPARHSVIGGSPIQMVPCFYDAGRLPHRPRANILKSPAVRGAKLIRGVSCGICRPSSHQVSRMRMVPSLAAGAGAVVPLLFPGGQEDGSKGPALRGMVPSPTPKRDHGDPQAFRLRSARAKGELVRAGGLDPPRALRPNGFSYPSTAFAAPAVLQQGLGSGLSLHRVPDVFPVVRCCPSSLYTFPNRKADCSGRAWLGIAMLQGCPTLSSSASPVSRRALKFWLKSDASADSATPAWPVRSTATVETAAKRTSLCRFYSSCSVGGRSE